MTTQETCDASHKRLLERKADLETLILEYKEASKDGRSPLDLLDVKDKFLNFSFKITTAMLFTKETHLKAQRERESAYTAKFLDKRSEIDGKTGKPISIDNAKMMAQIECAQEYINENAAEINYLTSRFYRDECQRHIDAIIQRVSVLKGEQFNSRQTSAS